MRNAAAVLDRRPTPARLDDVVCLTEYAGELLGERDRRRRWRRIVENWHVDQAAALREQEAARLALEKERERQARRDRSAQWKRMRDERAAKKARLTGRSAAARGDRHV